MISVHGTRKAHGAFHFSCDSDEPRARRPRAGHEMEQQKNDPVLLLAEVYNSAGEMTKAFGHLNEAAELRHYSLSAVNMFPQFESLRQDSRYDRLLKRMGLCG